MPTLLGLYYFLEEELHVIEQPHPNSLLQTPTALNITGHISITKCPSEIYLGK